jgi:DNA repair protein RadD
MTFQLRDYQAKCKGEIYRYWNNGGGNPLVSACVSSGKSLMIADLTKDLCTKWPDTRVLMLTHVKELIEQNYAKLRAFWPDAPAGIYSASVGERDLKSQVIFAGIQSIHKRAAQLGWADIVIVDEAHLISPRSESMYKSFLTKMRAINPNMRVLGFTGTPYRTGDGLLTDAGLFDDIVFEVGMAELKKRGYIMPLVSKQSEVQADISQVKTVAGEYNLGQLQQAFDVNDLTEAALDEVAKFGSDRKCGLFFCTGTDHAFNVRDALRARGHTAETITGKTPKKEREFILHQFKAGHIRYLTNDSVLTTGTDIPMLDLIVLLRSTKSPGLYTQILGRGVRCLGKDADESRANGKDDCLVLDFGGNIERFGPVDKIRVEKKRAGGGGGIGVQPVKICEVCREPSAISARVCEVCYAEFPVQDRVRHDPTAASGAIMSDDIKPETLPVQKITYDRHKKAGKPDSLKVTYWFGMVDKQSEWVCIEHSGFAREKANKWWMQRSSGELAPVSVTAALEVTDSLKKPSRVILKQAGKYREIVDYEFD